MWFDNAMRLVLQVMNFEVVIFQLLKYAKFILMLVKKMTNVTLCFCFRNSGNLNGHEIAQFVPKKQEYNKNGLANI